MDETERITIRVPPSTKGIMLDLIKSVGGTQNQFVNLAINQFIASQISMLEREKQRKISVDTRQ